MNLVELLKNYTTPELIATAASFLGESEHATSMGINSAIPSILGGILNSSNDHSLFGKIWDLINHQDNNSNLLSDLGSLFGGNDASTNSESLGGNLLKLLFGENNTGLLAGLGKYAGFNNSGSAMKILLLVAPLVLSSLKKKVKTEGYGSSGLSAWLSGNKNEIMSSIPAEIGAVLNFSTNKKSTTTHKVQNEPETNGSNWWPWLLGLLALLAMMWFGMKSCNNPKINDAKLKMEAAAADALKMATATADSLKNGAAIAMNSMYVGLDSTVRAKWIALGNMIDLNLPDGSTLSIPEKGIERKLITWIAVSTKLIDKTTWFDFDRILFETGSATLNAASKEQISNITKILKAFPKVNVKIGGYTDNVGNAAANKKLSQARAESMMKELISLGTDAKRLAAEGYGQDHPIGDNATPEGRERNRRISLRVTQK